jgi:hypothetical protein
MLQRPSARRRDVERLFEDPAKVVENEELSKADKLKILENWKLDLIELQRANDENMARYGRDGGDVAESLRAVSMALESLRGLPGSAAES